MSYGDYSIVNNVLIFNETPLIDYKIRCSYIYGGPSLINKEVPLGEINGTNKIFKLQYYPIFSSEHIFVNGLLMGSNDYSINNKEITLKEPIGINGNIISTYKTHSHLSSNNPTPTPTSENEVTPTPTPTPISENEVTPTPTSTGIFK